MDKYSDEILKEKYLDALRLAYSLDLEAAESNLRSIIADFPKFSDAYTSLALVKRLQGHQASQLDVLLSSFRIDSSHFKTSYQLALFYLGDQNPELAKFYAGISLEIDPHSVSAHLAYANAMLANGDFDSAIEHASVALSLTNGWCTTASDIIVLARTVNSQPTELSKKVFAQIVDGDQSSTSRQIVMHCLLTTKEHEQYLCMIANALITSPNNVGLMRLRISIYRSLGRYDDCFHDLYYLLSVDSGNLPIYHEFAEIYMLLKKYQQSLEVYLRILRLGGSSGQVLTQIGVCFRWLGRIRSAQKAFNRAFRLNAVDTYALVNLAEVEMRLGNYERSKKVGQVALNLDLGLKVPFYNLMFVYSVGEPCEMPAMLDVAKRFWNHYRGINPSQSPNPAIGSESHTIASSAQTIQGYLRADGSKMRVGIVSADIGVHCVSYFLSSLLRNYSKDQLHIELILPDRRYEPRELEMADLVDGVISLEASLDQDARIAIKRAELDIIIECNGYTGGTGISILAERCAPIQCHYIGYHGSTGLDTIDYFISDEHIITAEVARQLSEAPLLLSRPWLAFTAFEALPTAQALASVQRPVLGFFGNSGKITDQTLAYWSCLMAECKEALLALKCLSYGDTYVVKRLKDRLCAVGITAERVIILPPSPTWHDHLNTYNIIDYALDSTPWSSATTGFDALSMGVPLLAIQGNSISSRMSSSLVSYLGYPEWIAAEPSDYVRIAGEIAGDFLTVRKSKKRLQDEVLASSLFDGKDLAVSLEAALVKTLNGGLIS